MFAGASNESSQTFSFVVTTPTTGLFAIQPNIDASGVLRFRPKLNATGTANVTARLKDSGGTLRGGINLSSPQSFNIAITPHPLKPHKGVYSGLFYRTNGIVDHISSGFFTLTMGAYGAISGKVIGNGGKSSFTGQFDLKGHAVVDVPRNGPNLLIDMQLDLTNGTDRVTGFATDNLTVFADVLGDRATFSTYANPCPVAGRYTLVLPGSADWTNYPGGDSYAMLKVAANGKIIANGRLSDGTILGQVVSVSKNNNWPFYVSRLGGDSSVLGWLTFTNLSFNSLAGEVTWIRPSTVLDFYPAGFAYQTSAMGSTYSAPPPFTRVLDTVTNLFIFRGGNIDYTTTNDSILTMNNLVMVGSTNVLRLKSPASGFMSGALFHPTLKASRNYLGVALQQQKNARGFFTGNTQSGSFLLEDND
jgi:hypothetical protein